MLSSGDANNGEAYGSSHGLLYWDHRSRLTIICDTTWHCCC